MALERSFGLTPTAKCIKGIGARAQCMAEVSLSYAREKYILVNSAMASHMVEESENGKTETFMKVTM